MAAGRNLQENYDDNEQLDLALGNQKHFLFFELLQNLERANHVWPLAGALSRIGPSQHIGRGEAIALPCSSDTHLNNTHVAGTTDESSDTELVVDKNHGNTPESSGDKLPDVVILASCADIGPPRRRKSCIVMSKTRNKTLKRTVSFDECTTRPRLAKEEHVVDHGDGNKGDAAARRRTRSSGYCTGNSKDSDVTDVDTDDVFLESPASGYSSTQPVVQEDFGPQSSSKGDKTDTSSPVETHVGTGDVSTESSASGYPSTQPVVQEDVSPQSLCTAGCSVDKTDPARTSSPGDDISEDGEGSTSEKDSDVENQLDSSQSSFMLPDFETLGIDVQPPCETSATQQSESLGVEPFATSGAAHLGYDDMAEILLETLAPEPIVYDKTDKLLAQYKRDMEEDYLGQIWHDIKDDDIIQMIQEGAPVAQMEEAISMQLPSDIALTPVPIENPEVIPLVDEGITRRLQMAAQCDIHDCNVLPCRQGQKELAALEKYLAEYRVKPSRYGNEREMLKYLLAHGDGCEDELRCTVPYCQFIHECCHTHRSEGDRPLDLETLRQSLYRKYFSGRHELTNMSSESCDIIQLQGTSTPDRPNCDLLCRLVPHKDVFLVFEFVTSPEVRSNCSVLKKLQHFEDSQVDLLRRLNHPCIVTHHWLQRNVSSKTVILCTQFHGDCVCHWLRTRHPGGCQSVPLIQVILSHLLAAVTYLHSDSVNTLYLAWTGSDVVLGCTSNDIVQAKLCDFSHAVCMDWQLDEEDVVDVKQRLLPAIVPPESTLSLDQTDQWGLGCLLYEIALGHKVHRASVHEDPDTQRKAAEEMPDLTELERVDPAVAAVIRGCLKITPGERPTIDQLQRLHLDI